MSATVVALFAAAGKAPPDYQPGDTFATLAEFDPSQSASSIVMFLNTNCEACQRSTDALQRVARTPRRFQVVVVGYETEELLRQFVERSAIEADTVLSVPVGDIRFAAVPRVALLDRQGIVRSVWAGSTEVTEGATEIVASASLVGSTDH